MVHWYGSVSIFEQELKVNMTSSRKLQGNCSHESFMILKVTLISFKSAGGIRELFHVSSDMLYLYHGECIFL